MRVKTANLTQPKFPSAPFFKLTGRKVNKMKKVKKGHMGHQYQDGEKVGQMSLLFLKVRGYYGQRKAKIHTLLSPTILS